MDVDDVDDDVMDIDADTYTIMLDDVDGDGVVVEEFDIAARGESSSFSSTSGPVSCSSSSWFSGWVEDVEFEMVDVI